MQNLADALTHTCTEPLSDDETAELGTFVVFNERRYVTSSAKRIRQAGSSKVAQTPEGVPPHTAACSCRHRRYCGRASSWRVNVAYKRPKYIERIVDLFYVRVPVRNLQNVQRETPVLWRRWQVSNTNSCCTRVCPAVCIGLFVGFGGPVQAGVHQRWCASPQMWFAVMLDVERNEICLGMNLM